MKVLVTGHRGFIGGHLCDSLDTNGVDYLGIDLLDGDDIAKPKYLLKYLLAHDFKPHVIVHLAASCSTSRSIEDPRTDFVNNVVGTFEVCEAARWYGSRIIFTSSCKAWTGTPYGTSKAVGEQYISEYSQTYGVDNITNRPGTIYGPGQNASAESGWLSWFIKASLTNQHITIFGDGNQSRDVLYVTDYVNLLLKQINNFSSYRNTTFHVGGGKKNELTLLESLQILKYSNFSHSTPRLGDVKRFVSENDVLGWEPKIGYRQGIDTTVNYYKRML